MGQHQGYCYKYPGTHDHADVKCGCLDQVEMLPEFAF